MKLRDIIEQIDKTQTSSVEARKIFNAVDLSYSYDIDDDKLEERLRAYYVHKWYCTDTWVGYMLYFLDDEFVATSLQTARKNDTNFKFASKEAFEKVRKFLETLSVPPESEYDLVDLEDVIDEEQPVHFSGEILSPYVNYKGQKVQVVNRRLEGDWMYQNHNIEVKHEDGSTSVVKVEDITIPICLDKTKDYRDWDRARANG